MIIMRAQWTKVFGLGFVAFGFVGAASLAVATPTMDETTEAVQAKLQVDSFSLIELESPVSPDQPFVTEVELGGRAHLVALSPHSVRAPDFRVLAVDGESVRVVEPPAPATYLGELIDSPGSQISAARVHDGWRMIVRLGDRDERWDVVPLAEILPDAPKSIHVVYDPRDAEVDGWLCGNVLFDLDHPIRGRAREHVHSEETEPVVEPDADPIMLAELAYDADFEFFNRNGRSIDNVIADIESITLDMNVIYERDCFIRHQITTIVIREGEPDPYNSTSADGLLDEFRAEWNTLQSGVVRDVAHLMTGKSLEGSVIGLAYLGVICNQSFGYGLSESKFTSNLSQRVGLTAHEIGHNWDSGHCNQSCSGGSDCRIMCPCIAGCSGDVTAFGQASINAITSFRDTLDCLEVYNPFVLGSTDFISRQRANVDVTGGFPNQEVRVYYSLRGPGSCSIPEFNVQLDLQNCILGLTGQTDSAGVRTWRVDVPYIQSRRPILLQAAQDSTGLETPQKTDPIVRWLLPR
ncbi:MAG: M12 family metallo-peptidase [Phycisphaerales bacterium]